MNVLCVYVHVCIYYIVCMHVVFAYVWVCICLCACVGVAHTLTHRDEQALYLSLGTTQ